MSMQADGCEMDHPYTEWLGRPLDTVPRNVQSRVFEWVFGANLVEITRFAESCARRALSPRLRAQCDDVASRVAHDLVLKPLPSRPVQNWRAYVEHNVERWKVKELVRREGAQKRDAGRRVDSPDALAGLRSEEPCDGVWLIEAADLITSMLARMPDRYRPVFQEIFVVSTDGYDRRTIMEVARILSIPDGTVRRISSEGMPLLRDIAREELRAAA
ncbi:sigma factor-like helix-turn-helix DNA-binding protein [Nocardia sp. JW2]|uniref:sigma factor-like helix-turn-helix DNA-binding protein n=1 Tax=Nocardia sp. JW2 TaxID=3450738 RepID=UPI003F41D23F